ncbi:MAG: hypothetical protein OXF45_02820 [Candidatus Dadabacteria bacterium]|nr:hypothetical protein [Candidatus Dadabacteria bacterium]
MLLKTSAGRGRPLQSSLKRAISTAYYAMFHALCKNSADCLVGKDRSEMVQSAWERVYRSIDHNDAKKRCNAISQEKKFPDEIRTFARDFVYLQMKRHEADYNPASTDKIEDAQAWIDTARRAIKQMEDAPMKDRRVFAVWVSYKERNPEEVKKKRPSVNPL